MYSDEASMANGYRNNGTPLPIIPPQVIEEPQSQLVPQQPKPPAINLFSDQRIFINAPQYHWHTQGAIGTDEEARQQIVALTHQLYEFCH